MAVIRLEHVGIVVPPAAKEATVSFYERIFGWRIIREMPGVAFMGDGSGGRLELLYQESAPMNAPNHLAFVVPLAEFDAIAATIRETGVPMDEPMTNPAGRLVFFSDPAGNRAQIVGRNAPMPE